MNNVYIAETIPIFPQSYSAKHIANQIYPEKTYGKKINRIANSYARKIGIKKRSCVINLNCLPKIKLKDEQNHPLEWGTKIVNQLTQHIDKTEIGCFCLNYNLSIHSDTLPNLASQIVMKSGLKQIEKNSELAYYGCASAIYSLDEAVKYCREHDRAAIVFTFEHCHAGIHQLQKDDPNFRKMFSTNSIFSDLGFGLLIIPERLRYKYLKPLLKTLDINKKYIPGDLIGMKNGRFLMSSNLKHIIPNIVSNDLIKPFLNKHALQVNDIKQWSIHQGGSEIIKQFCLPNCLNLSAQQIKRSLDLFYQYGNGSSTSCLLVLNSFINDGITKEKLDEKGLVVAFGAGYYLGVVLYEWG